jgi:hypothetical protein
MADLTKLEPEVRTLARPAPKPLLAARALVQRDADLQVAFVRAKAEGWDSRRLVEEVLPKLVEDIDAEPEAVREAGLYLADEYLQGGDGIMLVSRETGKVLARLSEDDVWHPAPVRREDGSLVQPLPRMRPDLEGFLVHWAFDRSREQRATAAIAPWASSSAAAKQVTREGRQSLARQLRDEAGRFLADVRGGAREFLSAFEVTEGEVVGGLSPLPLSTACAKTRTPLADLGAFNFRFDVMGSQRGAIATGWVSEMARMLAGSCPEVRTVDASALTTRDFEGVDVWAAAVHAADVLRRFCRPAVYVEGRRTMGLTGRVGVLQLYPGSYRVESREVFDRWEVFASVDYTLWVDWGAVRGLVIESEPVATVVF